MPLERQAYGHTSVCSGGPFSPTAQHYLLIEATHVQRRECLINWPRVFPPACHRCYSCPLTFGQALSTPQTCLPELISFFFSVAAGFGCDLFLGLFSEGRGQRGRGVWRGQERLIALRWLPLFLTRCLIHQRILCHICAQIHKGDMI